MCKRPTVLNHCSLTRFFGECSRVYLYSPFDSETMISLTLFTVTMVKIHKSVDPLWYFIHNNIVYLNDVLFLELKLTLVTSSKQESECLAYIHQVDRNPTLNHR